jgi:hypothetical protein
VAPTAPRRGGIRGCWTALPRTRGSTMPRRIGPSGPRLYVFRGNRGPDAGIDARTQGTADDEEHGCGRPTLRCRAAQEASPFRPE